MYAFHGFYSPSSGLTKVSGSLKYTMGYLMVTSMTSPKMKGSVGSMFHKMLPKIPAGMDVRLLRKVFRAVHLPRNFSGTTSLDADWQGDEQALEAPLKPHTTSRSR